MKRLQRDAVLLSLVESLLDKGSWCGETHIQKATYFLQELTNVPLGFDFILYKHGPFSFDLRDEITAMRADGVLKLEPKPYPYGPSMLPGENSQALKRRFPKTLKKHDRKIEFIANELHSKGVAELERLGTALYVTLESSKRESVKVRASRVHCVKPHIAIEEAVEELKHVDAMKEQAGPLLS